MRAIGPARRIIGGRPPWVAFYYVAPSIDRQWDIEYSPLARILKAIMRIAIIVVVSLLGTLLIVDSWH